MGSAIWYMWSSQETQVPALGQEDPLEKTMATHSSILVWGIPWTEEPGRLQSTGSPWLSTHLTFSYCPACLSFVDSSLPTENRDSLKAGSLKTCDIWISDLLLISVSITISLVRYTWDCQLYKIFLYLGVICWVYLGKIQYLFSSQIGGDAAIQEYLKTTLKEAHSHSGWDM